MTTLRCLLILGVVIATGACRRAQTSSTGPAPAEPAAPAGTAVAAPAWKLKDVDGNVVSSDRLPVMRSASVRPDRFVVPTPSPT